MEIKRILVIEDTIEKYMDIRRYLDQKGFANLDWAKNAEKAVAAVEEAEKQNNPYSLLWSDMHFDYFDEDARDAGERTWNLLKEKGYDLPVVFCSSQNYIIPGSIGTVFYNPRRNWEEEADLLIDRIRNMN